MKLLKRETTTVSDGSVEITVKVITKAIQAGLIDIYNQPDSASTKNSLVDYVLRNCIDNLKISGNEYDPEEVAQLADMSDTETAAQLYSIVALALGVVFGSGEEAKKK